jgi:hypothetical protein
VRVGFRFLFTIPLLAVSLDSIHNAGTLQALNDFAAAAGSAMLSAPGAHHENDGPIPAFQAMYPVISHPYVACGTALEAMWEADTRCRFLTGAPRAPDARPQAPAEC